MANEQSAGPIQHLISISCDLAKATVELTVPTVGIKPGDLVVWQFLGLPESWSPWIEFQSTASFLGPFAALTQSGNSVWGEISMDIPTDSPFVYRAVIQKGQGTSWMVGAASIRSNGGTLVLNATDPGSLQQFTVVQQEGGLHVSPLGVIITPADTVEWDFSALSQAITSDVGAWRPMVAFQRYDGQGEVPDLYLGPFTSLTTSQQVVRGMGNNGVTGTYYFQVAAVRVSDGGLIWISSPDPAIDNRGGITDPTGTGGTGG